MCEMYILDYVRYDDALLRIVEKKFCEVSWSL